MFRFRAIGVGIAYIQKGIKTVCIRIMFFITTNLGNPIIKYYKNKKTVLHNCLNNVYLYIYMVILRN